VLEIPSHPLFQPRNNLIDAIIRQESSGKAEAIGKKGERGLMQIMPDTAAQYGVSPEQLNDPQINRRVGTRFFSDLLKRYKGNEFLALVAYNEGPGNVDKGRFLPQSVKYATSILDRAGSRFAQAGGQPEMQLPSASPLAGFQPAMQPPTQSADRRSVESPGILSRIGDMASRLLGEGTAYAGEYPPLPGGFQPIDPSPVGQPSAPVAPARAPAAGPQFQPSLSLGPGGMRVNLTPVQQPVQIRTQEAAAKIVLSQVDDALKFYDEKILPRESEFTGTLGTAPKEAIHGFMQWPEYHRSRWTEMFGGKGDPAIKDFYSKTGPVMAEQLKSLIGGRVGSQLISGPMAPHLPNPENDSLPTMRQKLIALKHNVPIIIEGINRMRGQGMGDDQILGQVSQLPYDESVGSVPEGSQPVYDSDGNLVGYQR
jgi:hypothetical protein